VASCLLSELVISVGDQALVETVVHHSGWHNPTKPSKANGRITNPGSLAAPSHAIGTEPSLRASRRRVVLIGSSSGISGYLRAYVARGRHQRALATATSIFRLGCLWSMKARIVTLDQVFMLWTD
jgi:hypothetical protein